jgi:hypothetical protein
MKTVVLSLALALLLSSNAFAILRPRFPYRPIPPYSGQVIVIGDDAIQKPAGKASK